MTSDHVFRTMMEYILKNDFRNAQLSAMSDMLKYDDNNLSGMIIMTAKNQLELIKIMAGFATMSDGIKEYYNNPEKAINDYRK